MASAVQHLLGGDGPTSAVTQMTSAVADFKVSDNAYQLFTTDLPKLGVKMPPSVWLTSTAGYQPQALAAFATKLLGGVVKSEPHKLHIDAITTNPPALRVQGNLQILAPASTVSVTAVVANLGQLAEQRGESDGDDYSGCGRRQPASDSFGRPFSRAGRRGTADRAAPGAFNADGPRGRRAGPKRRTRERLQIGHGRGPGPKLRRDHDHHHSRHDDHHLAVENDHGVGAPWWCQLRRGPGGNGEGPVRGWSPP